MKRNTNTNKFINKANFYGRVSIFFMLLSICTLIFSNVACSTITCQDANNCSKADTYSQKVKDEIEEGMVFEDKRESSLVPARRLIGSSPPQCTFKCGKCTPCKLFAMRTKHGSKGRGAYYPITWKCKCDNKLYDPYHHDGPGLSPAAGPSSGHPPLHSQPLPFSLFHPTALAAAAPYNRWR